MVLRYDQENRLRRLMRRSGEWPPLSWAYARVERPVDRAVHRLTGGRLTFTSVTTGMPMILLTTTGSRTGLPRTTPVVGMPGEAGAIIVIGSNHGQTRMPSWYYNLRADPRVVVTVDGVARDMVARELTGEEHEAWFARGLACYPGWAGYRERVAAVREMPVVELTPAARAAHAGRTSTRRGAAASRGASTEA
jgi:deazaflavin-dependent oxidoreductase (nitroreductase family)